MSRINNSCTPDEKIQVNPRFWPGLEGEVPDQWRQAHVSPIFKKGDKKKAENYRPVSLTCVA